MCYKHSSAPGPVEKLELGEVGSSRVSLSWSQPEHANGEINNYQILYWEGEAETAKGTERNPSSRDEPIVYTLSGLQAGTFYRVQVRHAGGGLVRFTPTLRKIAN